VASARTLAVAQPQAAPELAELAPGLALWLELRLRPAGIEPLRAPAEASAPAALVELARERGAPHALLPLLHLRGGVAEAQLLLFAPPSAQPLSVASATAPLAALGEAYEQALAELLPRLGAAAPSGAAPPSPPSLDELAASGRALRRLAQGELARAWLEVEGLLSPTAIAAREQVLERARRPDAPPADAARVLAAAGDTSAAWARIGASLPAEERAAAPDARLFLAAAEVQLARNNPREAIRYLERLDAADADAQIVNGRLHALRGDRARAREAFESAARLAPADPRPLVLLAELLEPPPAERAAALLESAVREGARLNLRRAERLLVRAAELDPGRAAAVSRERARLAQRVGRNAEALAAWRQAAQLAPPDAELWAGIGRAQRALGDAAAQASLEKALALEPRHAGALLELGALHAAAGRGDLAVPVLERAVEAAQGSERESGRVALARALRATNRAAEGLALLRSPQAAPAQTAESLREIAALERAVGEHEAARASLERAAALEPWDPELLRELASTQAQGGQAAQAAEAEELARRLAGPPEGAAGRAQEAGGGPSFDGLVAAFAGQVADPLRRRVAHVGLREPTGRETQALRWLHPREPDLATLDAALGRALGRRFALVNAPLPESPVLLAALDRLYAFERPESLDAVAIAEVNSALGVDAVFVSRLVRVQPAGARWATGSSCREPGSYEIELHMLSGQHPDLASILVDVECLAQGDARFGMWNRRALALCAALCLLLLRPLLRGWGTLVVEIRLPARSRGFFHIKIGRRPEKVQKERKRPKRDGRLQRSLASFSRYQKHMAGRETVFRWIPARRSYFVTVRGPLHDALGGALIGHFLEEQRVRIERGRPARLVYDFDPDECAVRVVVTRDGAPLPDARVALRGDRESLRYARDGSAFYYLAKGRHTICAGAGDRASERSLEIASLGRALQVDIDLADERMLLVRNAPAAVEPYLLGDFARAAQALEAAGEAELAHLMRGSELRQRSDLDGAAREFEAAGRIEEAAELRAAGSDHAASAQLFERAGDFARAADAYRAAGELHEAARCYEAAYDHESALECWEAVGEVERVLDLHEKTGAYLEAGRLAQRQGDVERALRNLKSVERRDPGYGEACGLLAEILAERGEPEAAAECLREAIECGGGDAAPVALHQRRAELLEQTSQAARALEAWEKVQRLDPGRGEVARRIAELRGTLAQATAATSAPTASGTSPRGESRYELLGELGRGGMGVVYRARDRRLDRIVALKRLPDNLRDNPTAVKLFLREARAAAALNHPNVVTVYDADEENGVYHITMELLEGVTLAQVQEKRGALNSRDVARLGLQVCAGLQYAHEHRVVHRDIKTGNLFLTRERVVKIMDFGLAKMMEEVRRESTVIGGTLYYMAPEQAAGGAVDARTDLYALGVTCFRLLTGRFPFEDGDLHHHHRHTPPPDPRAHAPELPEALARLVLELLAKDPQARPPSAAHTGERLRAIWEAAR
jgi:tetratricopeptide (TPR) repeat protein